MYSMKELLIKSQYQAYCMVKQIMNKFKNNRYKDGSYLVMNRGTKDKPKPMLCVHLDTINNSRNREDKPLSPNNFVFDRENQVWSLTPESDLHCLGGDDRAGLWIIFQLLLDKELSKKYSYAFFFDEEVGGKGSNQYMKDFPNDYEEGVTAWIGLDRKGKLECATYNNDNQELINLCVTNGFSRTYGTFTDASNLADNVACINLSVGYYNEHGHNEIICLNDTKETLYKLQQLVDDFGSKVYEAEQDEYTFNDYSRYYGGFSYKQPNLNHFEPVLCEVCGTHAPLYEADGYMVCVECIEL